MCCAQKNDIIESFCFSNFVVSGKFLFLMEQVIKLSTLQSICLFQYVISKCVIKHPKQHCNLVHHTFQSSNKFHILLVSEMIIAYWQLAIKNDRYVEGEKEK
jgi:hypothetical protein